MSQNSPIPKLGLAPKLKRPLSLWNPADYLLLLYWVFFFPQALQWYVDKFGGGFIQEKEMTRRKAWGLLRQNPIQRQLFVQGLIITVALPLFVSAILKYQGVRIAWVIVVLGVAYGVVVGYELGMPHGVAAGVAAGTTAGVVAGIALGVGFGVVFSLSGGVAFGLAWGVPFAFGAALGLAFGMANSVTGGIALGMAFGVAFSLGLGVPFGLASGAAFGLTYEVVFVVALAVAFNLAILRLENWLIGSILNLRTIQNSSWLIPCITPLSIPYLAVRLQNWLQQDWQAGLHNVNELLRYTLQFIPVVQAVNRVLAKTPDAEIIWRVSQLAEAPYDWRLVGFASASLKKHIMSGVVKGLLSPGEFGELISPPLTETTRLDTPARATAAGFWYLHQKEPVKAREAFAVVRPLLYGEEIFCLAQILSDFHAAKELAVIATIQISAIPNEPLLRPTTWEAIKSLHWVIEDAQIVKSNVSPADISFAQNHALEELNKTLNNIETVPEAERELIADITKNWQEALLLIK